jgi:hypothetical protein
VRSHGDGRITRARLLKKDDVARSETPREPVGANRASSAVARGRAVAESGSSREGPSTIARGRCAAPSAASANHGERRSASVRRVRAHPTVRNFSNGEIPIWENRGGVRFSSPPLVSSASPTVATIFQLGGGDHHVPGRVSNSRFQERRRIVEDICPRRRRRGRVTPRRRTPPRTSIRSRFRASFRTESSSRVSERG